MELVGQSWERAGSVKIWGFVMIIRHCINHIFVYCIEESTARCTLLKSSDLTKPILGDQELV